MTKKLATTGSSISGVAIEPAVKDVAANENAAANIIFFIFFSNFNHVTWLLPRGWEFILDN